MRKKHITIFSSFLVAILVFYSCSLGSNETYENADQMVTNALSEIQTISMQDLKLILEKKELVQVVDCREEEDYKNGHISGAVNVPRGLLEFSPKLSNRRIKTIVLGNAEGSGALAVETLDKMKYSDCYLLDCTMEKWADAFPEWIEKGITKLDVPLKEVKAPEGC
ncbi:MAG: rhodanese-like domain-containing protein [Bacteroidales bacterium]|nr:rhodanese-like domain-containing protein [Bacteroidales bacterium]